MRTTIRTSMKGSTFERFSFRKQAFVFLLGSVMPIGEASGVGLAEFFKVDNAGLSFFQNT